MINYVSEIIQTKRARDYTLHSCIPLTQLYTYANMVAATLAAIATHSKTKPQNYRATHNVYTRGGENYDELCWLTVL